MWEKWGHHPPYTNGRHNTMAAKSQANEQDHRRLHHQCAGASVVKVVQGDLKVIARSVGRSVTAARHRPRQRPEAEVGRRLAARDRNDWQITSGHRRLTQHVNIAPFTPCSIKMPLHFGT